MADPLLAQLLEVTVGAALLRIDRLVFDQDQAPVQVHSLYLSPQRGNRLDNRVKTFAGRGVKQVPESASPRSL
jgi:hypothetical protein